MVNESFFLENYQLMAGPLTEFDPNSILREIHTDVTMATRRALSFVLTGQLPDADIYNLSNTFGYVSKELAARGVLLNPERVMIYGQAIAAIANLYLCSVSIYPYWYSRNSVWVGARYLLNSAGSVEVRIDYADTPFDEIVEGQEFNVVVPRLIACTEMLIGRLGGKL